MTILEEIIAHKKNEIKETRQRIPIDILEKSALFSRPTLSITQALLRAQASGVIAEIKRKSPSQGVFKQSIDIVALAKAYEQAGASAISILTDSQFFGGANDDLNSVLGEVNIPILRKDFIIDVYQIIESKAIGADVILLIAAVLSEKQMDELISAAHQLRLEVIIEVHNEDEIKKIDGLAPDIVGVNNRDLKTFQVDLNASKRLCEKLNPAWVKISESGIRRASDIEELRRYGYRGFLIGQQFMEQADPMQAAREFIKTVISQ